MLQHHAIEIGKEAEWRRRVMDLSTAGHKARHAAIADVSDAAQQVGRQKVVARRFGELVKDMILHRELSHMVRQHSNYAQATQHDVVVVDAVEVLRCLR